MVLISGICLILKMVINQSQLAEIENRMYIHGNYNSNLQISWGYQNPAMKALMLGSERI